MSKRKTDKFTGTRKQLNRGAREAFKAADRLWGAFTWSETAEGHASWSKVVYRLEDLSRRLKEAAKKAPVKEV